RGRSSGQIHHPDFFSRCLVKSPELRGFQPLADEQQRFRQQRPSLLFERAKRRKVQLFQRWVIPRPVAQWNAPELLTTMHVERGQLRIWRFEERKSSRTFKTAHVRPYQEIRT